jgi:hypothetical protein
LQKGRVVVKLPVSKVLQPVHALIGLLEGDVQLGLEFGPRAAFPRGSIVGSNGIGGFAKLLDGFLCLLCRWGFATEGQYGQREKLRSLE